MRQTNGPTDRDMALVYARAAERERRELAAARERGAKEDELNYHLGRLSHWQDKAAAAP